MPAKYELTWDPDNRRWRVQHDGKRHIVSCRQLGVAGTKEASYQAANEWWRAKLSELSIPMPEPEPSTYGGVLTKIEFRRDWCRHNNRPEEAALWQARIEELKGHPDVASFDPTPFMLAPDIKARVEAIEAYGGSVSPDLDALSKEYQIGDGRVWEARDHLDRANHVPRENTLAGLSARFLELSATRVKDGELSAAEHDLAHRCVNHFVEWMGANKPVKVITPERWEAYWTTLRTMIAKGERSREYCKKDWRYARSFVAWLISLDKMPPLKNLYEKRYKIGESHTAVEVFKKSEVTDLVKNAKGQLKLHLLLMLNCGFYQADISNLLHAEIDYANGRITRQRSKTRQHHGKKVPTVRYQLWPVTAELLRRHRSADPVLALTNLRGKPWVEEKIVDNRVKSRRDGIKSNFVHLAKSLKITKPLKSFRKTSATTLDSEAKFARFVQHFLGHASKTVAEEHYLDRSGSPFDEAILWLGSQYGLA